MKIRYLMLPPLLVLLSAGCAKVKTSHGPDSTSLFTESGLNLSAPVPASAILPGASPAPASHSEAAAAPSAVASPPPNLVVAGSQGTGTFLDEGVYAGNNSFVASFTPDGKPDPSFNGSGYFRPSTSGNVPARACCVLQIGKQILLGETLLGGSGEKMIGVNFIDITNPSKPTNKEQVYRFSRTMKSMAVAMTAVMNEATAASSIALAAAVGTADGAETIGVVDFNPTNSAVIWEKQFTFPSAFTARPVTLVERNGTLYVLCMVQLTPGLSQIGVLGIKASDGSLVPAFGTGGMVSAFSLNGKASVPHALLLSPDGGSLLIGATFPNTVAGGTDISLVSLSTVDGKLNTQFGNSGFMTPFGMGSSTNTMAALAWLPDGTILGTAAVGNGTPTGYDVGIFSASAAGQLISRFNGKLFFQFGLGSYFNLAVALRVEPPANGNVMATLVGTTGNTARDGSDIFLARLSGPISGAGKISSLSLDKSFQKGGFVQLGYGTPYQVLGGAVGAPGTRPERLLSPGETCHPATASWYPIAGANGIPGFYVYYTAPAFCGSLATAVMVHGGGWSQSDPTTVYDNEDGYCTGLNAPSSGSNAKPVACAIPYYSGLESGVNAAVSEVQVAMVYQWLVSQSVSFGLLPDRIMLSGQSAGGQLILGATNLLLQEGLVPKVLENLAGPTAMLYDTDYNCLMNTGYCSNFQGAIAGIPSNEVDPLLSLNSFYPSFAPGVGRMTVYFTYDVYDQVVPYAQTDNAVAGLKSLGFSPLVDRYTTGVASGHGFTDDQTAAVEQRTISIAQQYLYL